MRNIADTFSNNVVRPLNCSYLCEGKVRVKIEVTDIESKTHFFNHALEVGNMGSLSGILFQDVDNVVVGGNQGFFGVVWH